MVVVARVVALEVVEPRLQLVMCTRAAGSTTSGECVYMCPQHVCLMAA